jgi:hypothetical protein
MDGRTYSTHTCPAIIQSWLDQAERSLHQEAGRVGLFGHGKPAGSGREFLVNRVLRPVLPAVHIGSGRVIDRHDRQSLQADIVLYDPRLPRLEGAGGTNLYFAEGVIAALVVKPRLTAASLAESLAASASILALESGAAGAGLPAPLPRTYVWAYGCDLSAELLADKVSDWCRGHESQSEQSPRLPSLIAGGRVVGTRNDDWLTLCTGAAELAEVELDGEQPHPVMGFWPTERPFGWLMLRLLHDIRLRVPPVHGLAGTQFTLDAYLTADQYFDYDSQAQAGHFAYWP